MPANVQWRFGHIQGRFKENTWYFKILGLLKACEIHVFLAVLSFFGHFPRDSVRIPLTPIETNFSGSFRSFGFQIDEIKKLKSIINVFRSEYISFGKHLLVSYAGVSTIVRSNKVLHCSLLWPLNAILWRVCHWFQTRFLQNANCAV